MGDYMYTSYAEDVQYHKILSGEGMPTTNRI